MCKYQWQLCFKGYMKTEIFLFGSTTVTTRAMRFVPTPEKGWAMVRRKRLATCTATSVDMLHRLSPRCSWIHRGSLPRLSARANLCHTFISIHNTYTQRSPHLIGKQHYAVISLAPEKKKRPPQNNLSLFQI